MRPPTPDLQTPPPHFSLWYETSRGMVGGARGYRGKVLRPSPSQEGKRSGHPLLCARVGKTQERESRYLIRALTPHLRAIDGGLAARKYP